MSSIQCDLIKQDIVKCRKDFGIDPDRIKHFESSSSLYYISDNNLEVVLNISIVNSDKELYKIHRRISVFKDDEQVADMRDDSNFREILKHHFKIKIRKSKLEKIK